MMEWLFGEDEVAELDVPGFKDFQALWLDEELVEEAEPRCCRVCGADVPSAGREEEVEDLEKLGTGSESTMLGVRWALLHRRSARRTRRNRLSVCASRGRAKRRR